MSIDFIVRDKMQSLLAEIALISTEEAKEIFGQKLAEFQYFCEQNYPKFSGYVDGMFDNDVSKAESEGVLEKIKAESFDLKNNLKLFLEFFIASVKLYGEGSGRQEAWLNELNKLD
jgi:hypothetical protein